MTPEESRYLNRSQLTEVLMQLAQRAKETNEPALAGILYIVCASLKEETEVVIALMMTDYVKARLGMTDEELNNLTDEMPDQ